MINIDQINFVLNSTFHLISNSERWTQYCMARDINNLPVLPCSKEAVRFCLMGGIDKSLWDIYKLDSCKSSGMKFFWNICSIISLQCKKSNLTSSISNLNDNFGHQQIINILKLTLENLSELIMELENK